MLGVFLRVVQAVGRYGPRFVNWAWANRSTVYKWIGWGLTVQQIVDLILRFA